MKIERPRWEHLLGALSAVIPFVTYLATLCPSVNFIDSGELSTVTYTLGIAHPTGYPLFTLLGYVFGHLPLGLRPIYQLNMFAAFLCAAGLYVFYWFLFHLLALVGSSRDEGARVTRSVNNNVSSTTAALSAFSGTLILGFSETYWVQALSIEVYPLHTLFLSLQLLLFLQAIMPQRVGGLLFSADSSRLWILFAYVLGMSFTNHMTTILLAPSFIVMYFWTNGVTKDAGRRILRLLPWFVAGLSVYLYLPIRSSSDPLLDWGNPESLETFFWHLGGKVYRVWFFSSTESAMKQLNYFANTLPGEFVYIPLILAGIGVIALVRTSKRLLVFSLLLFVSCVGYAINYDIHDIDSYFLLAYYMVAVWTGVGLFALTTWSRSLVFQRILVGCGIAAALMVGAVNVGKVDMSDNTLVEQYTHDVLESVEPGSVIISYQWDYFVSASYYVQHVENYRADVAVIDKELLRRSWYYEQLGRMYPWLLDRARLEVDLFLKELYRFEHGLPYSAQVIEERYRAMILKFIVESRRDRRVFVTAEIEPEYTAGYQRVPHGIVYELTTDQGAVPSKLPSVMPVATRRIDTYVQGIYSMYVQSYVIAAQFMIRSKEYALARGLLEKALEIRPESAEARMLYQRIIGLGN